jgi:hypothetical protein
MNGWSGQRFPGGLQWFVPSGPRMRVLPDCPVVFRDIVVAAFARYGKRRRIVVMVDVTTALLWEDIF